MNVKNDLAQAYLGINHGKMQARPLVGISACLCGDRVRYDGQDKGVPELVQALEKKLELLKVCPEVAIGMGVPRPPIQLTLKQGKVEARGVENPSLHVTTALQNYAQSIIESHTPLTASKAVLCGFILKSRSPSCGVGSTPIHEGNRQVDLGNGIFSQQLQRQLPWLPVAEDEALLKPQHQLNFVMQSQLVQLFWKECLEKTEGVASFHQQIHALLDLFPLTVNYELEQLAKGSTNKNPRHYLTHLIKALQAMQQQH